MISVRYFSKISGHILASILVLTFLLLSSGPIRANGEMKPGTRQGLAVFSKSSTISDLSQVKGKRICVLTGSTGDFAARAHFPGSTFLDMKTASDAALAITTGKADAFVFDKETLLNLVKNNPGLKILETPVGRMEIAAVLAKENTTLLAEINGLIGDMQQNGSLQQLKKKWFDEHNTTMPPITENARAKVLRLGTDPSIEPYSFVQNGNISGLDIELGQALAARTGKRLKIMNFSFEGLIPALRAGNVDFVLSGFTVTEERKKLASFSTPYLVSDIVVLVKKEEGSTAPTFLQSIRAGFYNNLAQEQRYLLIWDGLKTTVFISICATVFGTLLGGLICFMRMSSQRFLSLSAQVYISILRGMPVLVLLMFIFYVVFASVQISPVAVAVIAFGMNFAAYAAEIFRSGIEGIDKGQTEAAVSIGFTRTAAFVHIILPQMVRRILPVYKGEFITLVKMTSIVGYIAVQDLTKASDIIRSRTFDAFFPLLMVAILYFLISWILVQSLEYLERRTDPKRQRTLNAMRSAS